MIRTRFAPSPTGSLHIGSLRSAVYPYALARHSNGVFILRIDDTDQKRLIPGSVEKLQETLKTFGLNWDEFYVQSQRLDIYQQAAKKLVSLGHAYVDEGAIRLKIPKGEEVSFHDYVLDKAISWSTDVLQDLVILKSDGFPTYHLASVMDDHDMEITHVLRGHDWLPSTPIHLLIYKYLNYDLPQIGHLTDILDPSGGKLSKRKGSVSCEDFLASGYLPEAILNFVILLGWAPKDNRELFTLEEFVENFDPKGFQKSNPVLNLKKLDWFNGHYIRSKSDDELLQLIKPHFPQINKQIIPLIKERITTLSQVKDIANFFFTRSQPQSNLNKEYLQAAYDALNQEQDLQQLAKDRKFDTGEFFMTLRLAICGQKITPPLTESMLILGKDECLIRIKQNL